MLKIIIAIKTDIERTYRKVDTFNLFDLIVKHLRKIVAPGKNPDKRQACGAFIAL